MTLMEAILTLDDYLDGSIIYAGKIDGRWVPDSPTEVVQKSSFEAPPETAPPGTEYFLEVDLAIEAIEGFADHRGRGVESVSAEEKFASVCYYAEEDSYLPPS